MGDLGKAHRIHVTVNNREDEHQSKVIETSGMIVIVGLLRGGVNQ
jgi:hypothetical protein